MCYSADNIGIDSNTVHFVVAAYKCAQQDDDNEETLLHPVMLSSYDMI